MSAVRMDVVSIQEYRILKEKLSKAEMLIQQQEIIIQQQSNRIEELTASLSFAKNDFGIDRKNSQESSHSKDNIDDETIGYLGITNNRDLTKFAVRRRLVSPQSLEFGNGEEIEMSGHGSLIFPPSSFVTPKNVDDNFEKQTFQDSSSSNVKRVSSLSSQSSDDLVSVSSMVADSLSLEDNTPARGPPKGLAARLAMSAKDRRKIGIGKRSKLGNISISDTSPSDTDSSVPPFPCVGSSTPSPPIEVYSSMSLPEGAFARALQNSTSLLSKTPRGLESSDSFHSSEYSPENIYNHSTMGENTQRSLKSVKSCSSLSRTSSTSSEGLIDDDSLHTWDSQTDSLKSGVSKSASMKTGSLSNLFHSEPSLTESRPKSHYTGSSSVSSTSSNSSAISYGNRRPDSIPISSSPRGSSGFSWKRRSNEGSGSDQFLFIAHDNPRLVTSLTEKLQGSSPLSSSPLLPSQFSFSHRQVLSSSSSAAGIEVMLETKTDDGDSCFLLSQIVYSGDFDTVESANMSNQRGCAWLVCLHIWGVKAPLNLFPTKSRGEIMEIDLHGLDKSYNIPVSNRAEIEHLFRSCTSKVDVILDPSHNGSWYPYYEGRRKMAPQFRSKGVGYLRLGDDMSQFGSAFLSLDAGETYLDFGRLSVRAKDDWIPPRGDRGRRRESSSAEIGNSSSSSISTTTSSSTKTSNVDGGNSSKRNIGRRKRLDQ